MSRQIILSQEVVEAGLWYILSLRYDEEISRELQKTPVDVIDMLQGKFKLSSKMKEDLEAVLEDEANVVRIQQVSDRLVGAEKSHYVIPCLEDVWPRIVLARKRAIEKPETTIPAAIYERLRTKDITERGVNSSQGMVRWPPTCQTITKRCGGTWNQALENLGLATSKRGRACGSLKFSDEIYLKAALEFVNHCHLTEKSTTVAYYSQWVARERRAGRNWPSAAAQRQMRGTWNQVIEKAEKIARSKRLD